MIILITGASHTGKTLLAQKMLEKNGYPYLSIDHLKTISWWLGGQLAKSFEGEKRP